MNRRSFFARMLGAVAAPIVARCARKAETPIVSGLRHEFAEEWERQRAAVLADLERAKAAAEPVAPEAESLVFDDEGRFYGVGTGVDNCVASGELSVENGVADLQEMFDYIDDPFLGVDNPHLTDECRRDLYERAMQRIDGDDRDRLLRGDWS